MNSFWTKAYGCQADDCYELLQTLLQAQGEILEADAARFLGLEIELVRPLFQRLLEEGLAALASQSGAWVYRRPEPAGQRE